MKIGIDLDNTILNYDISHKVLIKKFLKIKINTSSKNKIKKIIIKKYGIKKWIEYQSILYSEGLKWAYIDNFCKKFIFKNIKFGNEIYIISHKTVKSYYNDKIFLRKETLKKIKGENITGRGMIKSKNIYFFESLEKKVNKIKNLNIDIFIDDLEKVFSNKYFPKNCKKILINLSDTKIKDVVCYKNWKKIFKNEI